MISKDLKELIDLSGGRYIIVEDGRPKYIVMNFDEYRSAVLDRKKVKSLTEEELVKKINEDIALWKENQENPEESLVSEIEKLEEVRYV